jgi:phytoene dehydrogenase-like protein
VISDLLSTHICITHFIMFFFRLFSLSSSHIRRLYDLRKTIISFIASICPCALSINLSCLYLSTICCRVSSLYHKLRLFNTQYSIRIASAVAYMAMDLHKPNAVLDYPKGGMDSLIQALVQGLESNKGELRLNSRVNQFILEDGTCKGVVLANGQTIKANKAVVCNAPLWNMARIAQDSIVNNAVTANLQAAVQEMQKQANDMSMTGSFMHLHLGIPSEGLSDIECHHSVLDWSKPVTDEQNMVIISIPTVFDPNLAPPGYHIVHAYTAACDSFEPWQDFLSEGETGRVGASPNTNQASRYNREQDYQKLKDVKAEVLWKAIECVIPDVRQRARQEGSLVLVGTPLTHRRYNQRFRGTYGPAPKPGQAVWELNGAQTPIPGLLACGDTCFPGIGLPGVAASGTIAANSCATLQQQQELIKSMRQSGGLQ